MCYFQNRCISPTLDLMMKRTIQCLSLVLLDKVAHPSSPSLTVAKITLNIPKALNAMTVAVGEEYKAIISDIEKDKSCRAVVITGAGRAFSAGGDLQFIEDRMKDNHHNNVATMVAFYTRFLNMRKLRIPLIAAVNGPAVGAGMCLALACDIRVAADSAKFCLNFTKLGLHAGMGSTYFLPRVVGHANAAKLFLTSEMIDAQEAKNIGLVTSLHTVEEVLPKAMEIANQIALCSPTAVRQTLDTLRKDDPSEMRTALWREAESQADSYAMKTDLAEALAALREKREPKFQL